MRIAWCPGSILAAAALVVAAAPTIAVAEQPPVPAAPAVNSIPVKEIVVANFEPGEDTGNAPGEFQLWAEREKLTEGVRKGAINRISPPGPARSSPAPRSHNRKLC